MTFPNKVGPKPLQNWRKFDSEQQESALILSMQYWINSTNSEVISNVKSSKCKAELVVKRRVKLRTSWSMYLNHIHYLNLYAETHWIQRKQSPPMKMFWGISTDGKGTSPFSFASLSSQITNFFIVLSNFNFGNGCTFSSCMNGWEAANKRRPTKLTLLLSSSRLHQTIICSQSSCGKFLNLQLYNIKKRSKIKKLKKI